MRKKIDSAPLFPLIPRDGDLKLVADYRERLNKISMLLDQNPLILDAFHGDLETWGASSGRESTFTSEQVLRSAIIKTLEGLPYRDTIIRISESDFLRNFTRFFSGDVMNFTVLDTALKIIQPQTWQLINELLFKCAKNSGEISGEKFRIDSTVSETNIHYPTDASLLYDSFRVIERLMKASISEDRILDYGYRFHDKKIKGLYTLIARYSSNKKRSTKRKVRTATAKLIGRVDAVVKNARTIVEYGKQAPITMIAQVLIGELQRVIGLADKVIEQSRRAYRGETVPAAERIFSIFETHTELLMRGKARKPVEFGHMVSIGQTEEKFISFYCVEEKSRHDVMIGDEALEDHRKKFGRYPKHFTADKNYYGGPEHTKQWEEKIDVYSVGKKGNRTPQEEEREHGRLFKLLQMFRAGCEGTISTLKRAFGLARCLNRGFKSFASTIGSIVFCHNLVVLSKL